MSPRKVTPLGGGLTRVELAAEDVREDLREAHDFKLGERVRQKQHHEMCGVVASLPDPDRPVVLLGTHILGNEMGVELDGGGRAVSNVDRWEREPSDPVKDVVAAKLKGKRET